MIRNRPTTRGTLRIYLGAAPGVGKTYAMLNEGWRRRQRGADVVIGLLETHGRLNTAEQIRDLEVVPTRQVAYRDTVIAEMDLDAILARKPDVCLVDELAHTNAPGSRNEKRWQDIHELLAAGIEVISTVNIQHLESLNDVVERITGVQQRETVPDTVVRGADQIELVDMSPEALRRRMAHGNVYPAERVDSALSNYFRAGNLGALRELALLWVADRVEESLQGYLETHGIVEPWETRERVVVAVTGAPSSDGIIRRAARMAGRRRGELVAVHVASSDGLQRRSSPSDVQGLEARRRLVNELGGRWCEIVADDRARALVQVAREEHATQLVIGTGTRTTMLERITGTLSARVIALSGAIDVHVIATPATAALPVSTSSRFSTWRNRSPRARLVSPLRMATGWALTVVGLPLLTVGLVAVRDHVAVATTLMAYLIVVLAIAAIAGRVVSLLAALIAALLENWYFVAPLHTMTIGANEDAIALVVFVIVALVVGTIVNQAARTTADAHRSRTEAEAFARSSASLAGQTNPLPDLVNLVRSTFAFTAVALLARERGAWSLVAGSGEPVPADISDGTAFELGTNNATPDHFLVVTGRQLTADDRRVMTVLSAQLSVAVDSQRLAEEAAAARVLSEIDGVRTGLLRSVSHDLRSPLSAIKTYVSGLRADDVHWTEAQVQETLAAIELETDRLNRVVGNLLDASRLDAGMTAMNLVPTLIGEVISAAVAGIDATLEVAVDPELPLVWADPALLERSIANVVSNAVRHHPDGSAVRIDADRDNERVHVRIIDRGSGIAPQYREKVLAPFQRLDDRGRSDGVGLGLAIASGFVEAMSGTFTLNDTPGGGLTVEITLPVVGASSAAADSSHPTVPGET